MRTIASVTLALAASVFGLQAQADDSDLAKQLANPIASLISVPFQLNYNSGYGTEDGNQTVLNIQPVVPISISENWNMISRTILPVIGQNDIAGRSGSQSGLGDITQSLFFTPKATGPSGVIWGVGPAFLIPTATDDALGTGKWGIGPTGVVLKQFGPWTVGGLANHIWSFAGDDDRADVNSTFVQPFINYTTSNAWSFVLNTESSYNWETEEWSVPINAGISKMTRFGDRPVSLQLGARYWAESPDNGPEGWGVRAALTLLYPKK
ncbi:transporter [Paracoccus marinaquae]|uniref:Transporter n=1 Tax=Paracoccus marinaquae TaxID=2841926 RepID=A0ABS6ALQ9_9RHOB|nr:transporter [Paracoccus marinaquae]MBU3031530.1 transporter [Paracoccus marinaquae]